MEKLFSDKERSDANYFPRFYFLLVPFGSQGLNSGDQWSGIFNSLKGELQKKIGSMEEKIGSMERKMEERMDRIDAMQVEFLYLLREMKK
jgi:hypothetical protein